MALRQKYRVEGSILGKTYKSALSVAFSVLMCNIYVGNKVFRTNESCIHT